MQRWARCKRQWFVMANTFWTTRSDQQCVVSDGHTAEELCSKGDGLTYKWVKQSSSNFVFNHLFPPPQFANSSVGREWNIPERRKCHGDQTRFLWRNIDFNESSNGMAVALIQACVNGTSRTLSYKYFHTVISHLYLTSLISDMHFGDKWEIVLKNSFLH